MWLMALKWVLNPKNLILVLLSIACVGSTALWKWEQITSGRLQNKVDNLQGHVDSLTTQVSTRDTIIDDMKKNLTSIALQMEEMKQAEAKTIVIRKKVRELVYIPTGKACETSDQLGEEYGKVASDISQRIISSVRGKVTTPTDNNSDSPTKTMPPSITTGNQSNSTDGARATQ